MAANQTLVITPRTGSGPGTDSSIPLTYLENTSRTPSSENDSLASEVPRLQKTILVIQLSGVTFFCSVINGLVIIGLPAISKDLELPSSLAFWPASVSGLATASSLLLTGSVTDAVGPRWVGSVGSFACGGLTIGAGVSRKGTELVAMRALQGVGLSLHLASSVALVTQVFPQGKSRNLAFSFLGLSQPFGFSVGLVLGGVLVDTVGWRVGWYISGASMLLLSFVGLWAFPKGQDKRSFKEIVQDMKSKVDWVGAMLASSFMALLCYLLAVLSTDVYRIKEPGSITLLCLSTITLPCFLLWVHRQVCRGKPALIPNSLWRNATFSSICVIIALSFAVINSMELFASLL
ncbi:hypothetical protein CDD83_2719 [Cordyceps sp. RAO-2017]|nr:hypothetical protein CDD83_2719 [Cordyceps sp. RAO-2017]